MKSFWNWYSREMSAIVQKCGELLRSRYGLWFLGVVSFADSALGLPIVTDPFMVAYIMSNRSKAFIGALVTIVTSVLGGTMIYLFSAFFIEQLLTLFPQGATDGFYDILNIFDERTFALAFLGALAPVPYTFVAIAAGALKGNIFMFILGSLAGRIIRFGTVAYLTYRFGDRALTLAKRHILRMSVVAVVSFGLYLVYQAWM